MDKKQAWLQLVQEKSEHYLNLHDGGFDEKMRARLVSCDYENQTVALIAHDALKPQMLEFAAQNFALLSRFRRRVGTGTTGQKLNEMAWSKGWPADKPWVDRYNSGPLGGDAQIADLVLEKRCHRAIFFEDPHVARQHEADIQLLERAVTTVTHDAVCSTSPQVAQRWCDAAVKRAG